MPTPPATRDAEIAALYAQKITPTQIAVHYGITRQRVHQILGNVARRAKSQACTAGRHGDTWTGEAIVRIGASEYTLITTVCRDCDRIVSQERGELREVRA